MIEELKCKYGVITSEGQKVFDDPLDALQYSAYMESVGSDLVFLVVCEVEGKVDTDKRLSIYDMKKALRGDLRGR